ncbi:MAG: 7TM domain-containing protein [Thermoguttaceae bacterium]
MRLGRSAGNTFVLLVACGVVSIAWRYHARGEARLVQGETAWRLTYEIDCDARRVGAELRIAAPADTASCRVFRQDFRQENLRMDPRGRSAAEGREIVELAVEAGPCESTLQFDLRLNPQGNWPSNQARVRLTADEQARYLESTAGIQAAEAQVARSLAALGGPGLDPTALVHRVFRYCEEEISVDEEEGADDAARVLEEFLGNRLGCARAMIALCRAAGIPARPVCGFIVDSGEGQSESVWVEAFVGNRWVPYDPVNGYEGDLPCHYVAARRGDDRVVLSTGARQLEFEYSIMQLPRASLGLPASTQRPSDILDLTRLPLGMQRILALILLLPLGALLTCIFRNLVGLKTSGTFTPTLLALSFVFTDWRTGLVIALAVITLGIGARFLIDSLKLLMLPRLSIMLTLAVLCIVFGISGLAYFRAAPAVQSVLLPMVILTMLVERFYVTTQEDGVHVALQHLAGTALVGFCCYLVLCWDTVAQLLLAYPEAHFFTVASMVLIGRYTGYQLLEPWRFRSFVDLRQA